VLHAPDSRATAVVLQLAAKLLNMSSGEPDAAAEPQAGFFSRLAIWLGIIEEID